jgi:hypothetical protein
MEKRSTEGIKNTKMDLKQIGWKAWTGVFWLSTESNGSEHGN